MMMSEAVNCKELMKSFGWDTTDAFTQHDAQESRFMSQLHCVGWMQELNRILCDRIEERLMFGRRRVAARRT